MESSICVPPEKSQQISRILAFQFASRFVRDYTLQNVNHKPRLLLIISPKNQTYKWFVLKPESNIHYSVYRPFLILILFWICGQWAFNSHAHLHHDLNSQ